MSFDSDQLRYLTRSILKDLPYPYNPNESCWSKSAEELILGTIAQESAFGSYIEQVPSKIAKGIAQIEPFTFNDIMDYLKTENRKGWSLLNETIRMRYMVNDHNPTVEELRWNNGLSIALCRVKYLRVPHSLPPHDEVNALGSYWAFHYWAGNDDIPKHINQFRNSYRKYVEKEDT